MKDIKNLYLTAKRSGSQRDISAYSEAVQELLESNPSGFISNLEYIITSDMNLSKLDDFVEKYGLSIPACNLITGCLNMCIERCNERKIDPASYEKYLEKYEAFKNDHKGCFDMYEYYRVNLLDPDYIPAYYGFNENGVQGRKLAAGMIKRFGDVAVPDAILTATSINELATSQIFEYLNKQYTDGTICQWIIECANSCIKDDHKSEALEESLNALHSKSIGCIVESIQNKTRQVIREAAIMGNTDTPVEYTESDINYIQDMISFMEYKVTCASSTEDALKIQNEIYSLYESFDGLVNEDGTINISFTEGSEIDTAAKKVAGNLIKLGKKIKRELIRECNDARKENNKEMGFFSKAGKPAIFVKLGNKKGEFGLFFQKSKAAKIIINEGASGRYFDNLLMYIGFQFSFGAAPNFAMKKNVSDIIDDTLKAALADYLDSGVISYHKTEIQEVNRKSALFDKAGEVTSLNEYAYTYTIYYLNYQIPLYISKEHAFEGVDETLFESVDPDNLYAYFINVFNESLAASNTTNKYTGNIPGYLSSNHDLSYGEDDDPKKRDDDSIDKYVRPSSSKSDKPNADPDEVDDKLLDEPDEDGDTPNKDDKKSGNTYYNYYYQYHDSFNKNSNSFNKDSSKHDDHSTHSRSTVDDHSVRKTDDHSTGKRIHSGGDNTSVPAGESSKPWELNLFPRGNLYTEGFGLFKGKHEDDDDDEEGHSTARSPSTNEIDYIPLTEEEESTIVDRILNVRSIVQKELDPLLHRYEKYSFSISINNDGDAVENADDLNCAFRVRVNDKLIPGIFVWNGDYSLDVELAVTGFYLTDFIEIMTEEYPEEVERLSKTYNLDSKFEWSRIMWNEKLFGYDKSIQELGDEITNIVNTKFKMIHDFDYLGDGKGVNYGGTIDDNYILQGIDVTNIQHAKKTVTESALTEAVGDADDMRPESDHPVRETLQDVDRALVKTQQAAKKKVQGAMQAGQTFMKPIKRTHQWVTKLCNEWKDKDENKLKEKMADPHARKNIFSAIAWSIKTGSFLKAGLLLNPVFLFLTITKKAGAKRNEQRLRREMIGELKVEMEIIDEKIKDAASAGDNKAKYKLMRLKNEINKKLLRVGGADVRDWKKIL